MHIKKENTKINILIYFLVLVFIFINFIIRPVRVNGSSMETTYYNGTYVIINQLPHNYTIGEVIVFKSPVVGEDYIIKRIVGIEYDLVEIIHNKVYVNGVALEETYISSEWTSENISLIVPEGEVFVLGDNRDNSLDSRFFDTISINSILGYVV